MWPFDKQIRGLWFPYRHYKTLPVNTLIVYPVEGPEVLDPSVVVEEKTTFSLGEHTYSRKCFVVASLRIKDGVATSYPFERWGPLNKR